MLTLHRARRLPRSTLPLIHKADQKLKDIITAANSAEEAASPAKKAKVDNVEHFTSPEFSFGVQQAIKHALEAFKPPIPDSFPGPYNPLPLRVPSGGWSLEEVVEMQHTTKSVLTSLLDLHAVDSLKSTETGPAVYRVAVLAGLWQFRGLDADVDKALHLIWQGALLRLHHRLHD